MNFIKKLLLVAMSFCFLFGAVACTDKRDVNTTLEGNLTISVFDGSYGTEWIYNLAAKFEAKYEGAIVTVVPDAGLLSTIKANLDDQKNEIDLYFSHGIAWETFAKEKLLENLDDLYSSEVSGGVTFAQRVEPKALAASKAGGYYYKAPWTRGAGGFVYNTKMFADNGWTVPTTYAELVKLCKDISDKNIQVSTDVGMRQVKPFIWPGIDEWLWDYVFYEWWGQLAGFDEIENFLKYDDKENFNPATNNAEFKEAYKYWYDLVAVNKNYSDLDCTSLNKYDALTRFVNGWAAMMPNAHWIYNDVNKLTDGFEMAMFNAPTLPNAKAGYEKVNFSVGFGDSAVISRKSKDKVLAKEFLRFMSLEENCLAFSEDVPGTALAYNYDFTAAKNQPIFAQSINKIHTENVAFNIYSNSNMAINNGSEKLAPWPMNSFYYVKSFLDNKAEYTPDSIMDFVYTDITDNWAIWSKA